MKTVNNKIVKEKDDKIINEIKYIKNQKKIKLMKKINKIQISQFIKKSLKYI